MEHDLIKQTLKFSLQRPAFPHNLSAFVRILIGIIVLRKLILYFTVRVVVLRIVMAVPFSLLSSRLTAIIRSWRGKTRPPWWIARTLLSLILHLCARVVVFLIGPVCRPWSC
jgi:hypothetical protein